MSMTLLFFLTIIQKWRKSALKANCRKKLLMIEKMSTFLWYNIILNTVPEAGSSP